ncbi:MAG: signal peptidase I [Ilumatobacteraceae bacterium]
MSRTTPEPQQFDGTFGWEAPSAPEPPGAMRRLRELVEWVVIIAVAISAAFFVKAYVVQQFQVAGNSMKNTLQDTDRVLVNKLSYRLHDPNRGDVVVLKTIESSGERDLIKRVIGLPGETIDVRNCQVYIDGRLLVEPYLDPEIAPCTDPNAFEFPYLVPDDTVFVMGDNRPGSKDSRDIGAVEYADLLGRAFVVIWPTEDWEWL